LELSQLIHIAKRYGIKFVYALSPGLDITYSSEKDLNALKRKFNQVLILKIDLKEFVFFLFNLVIKFWM